MVTRSSALLGACAVGLLLSSGCAAAAYKGAAEKARAKNRYAAIEYLALCLKEAPDNAEAKALAEDLGKQIAEEHQSAVKGLEGSKKFEEAVAECDRVVAMKAVLAKLPGGIDIYHDKEERPRLAEAAAAKFYGEAEKVQSTNKVKAVLYYRRCLGFNATYKDAQQRYQACLEDAMTKLAIPAFKGEGSHGKSLAADVTEKFKNALVAKNPELIRVVSQGQDNAVLHGAVQCAYSDSGWVAKPMQNTSTVSEDTGQVDAKGNTIYQDVKVKCSWTHYKRSTSFKATVRYDVKDNQSGASKAAGSSSSSDSDTQEYDGGLQGDERALPLGVTIKDEAPGVKELETYKAGIDKSIEELTLKLFTQFKAK